MDKIAKSIELFIKSILGLEDPSASLLEIFLPQIISILILVVAIKFLFWNKVTQLIDARRYHIETEIKEAESLKQNAINNDNEIKARLEDIKAESKVIIDEARANASRQAAVILEKANHDATQRVEKAMDEIELETKKAREELRNDFAELVLAAAEKVVEKEIDLVKHNAIIETTLRELE